MKKFKTKGRRSLTREQRTQIIIDGFRGLPDEFGMLKGLLCVDGVVSNGARDLGKDYLDQWAERNHFHNAYDSVLIAARMDELRRAAATECRTLIDLSRERAAARQQAAAQ